MTSYAVPLLKMTNRDTETIAGTKVSKFRLVRVLVDREDGWSVCNYDGTFSMCIVPTEHLRDPYKEDYPVKAGEDPLESREFFERCQRYRATGKEFDQNETIAAFEELKEFIQFHYQGRRQHGS